MRQWRSCGQHSTSTLTKGKKRKGEFLPPICQYMCHINVFVFWSWQTLYVTNTTAPLAVNCLSSECLLFLSRQHKTHAVDTYLSDCRSVCTHAATTLGCLLVSPFVSSSSYRHQTYYRLQWQWRSIIHQHKSPNKHQMNRNKLEAKRLTNSL